jgi:hypothetical protein
MRAQDRLIPRRKEPEKTQNLALPKLNSEFYSEPEGRLVKPGPNPKTCGFQTDRLLGQKFLVVLVLVCIVPLSTCDLIFPDVEIVVTNNSVAELTTINAKRSSTDNWGENQVGTAVPPEGSTMFYLTKGRYDFRLTFGDSATAMKLGIDLRHIEVYALDARSKVQ